MGAMNEFKVLDPNGHTRTEWDAESAEEVETARRVYEEFIRRGYRAFRVDARTGESSVKRWYATAEIAPASSRPAHPRPPSIRSASAFA